MRRRISAIARRALAGTTLLTLAAGCASRDHQLAMAQANMTPCCANFSEIPYEDLVPAGTGVVSIDENSLLYAFRGGKSFFKAYRLASDVRSVTVKSFYDPDSLTARVFRPVVTVLHADYSKSRTIRLPLKRQEYGVRPMFVYGTVKLEPEERLLIVHTDDEAYGDSFHHFYPKEEIEKKAYCIDPAMSAAVSGALGFPVFVPASKDSICKNPTGKAIDYSVTGKIEVLGANQ